MPSFEDDDEEDDEVLELVTDVTFSRAVSPIPPFDPNQDLGAQRLNDE